MFARLCLATRGGAALAVRSQAEPGNEILRRLLKTCAYILRRTARIALIEGGVRELGYHR